MSWSEVSSLIVIFVGFLGLIIYVARHARSGDE